MTRPMTIAEQKKEENIIEYVLYMWSMEELQRMVGFDMDKVEAYLKSSLETDTLLEELSFHNELGRKMADQKILKKGHVYDLEEIMVELHYLHTTLINLLNDKDYKAAVEKNEALLGEFKKKTDGKIGNDIEAMLTALFGFLKLKMSGQEISEGTKEAIASFSDLLGQLAKKYKLMKQGHLDFNLN